MRDELTKVYFIRNLGVKTVIIEGYWCQQSHLDIWVDASAGQA